MCQRVEQLIQRMTLLYQSIHARSSQHPVLSSLETDTGSDVTVVNRRKYEQCSPPWLGAID